MNQTINKSKKYIACLILILARIKNKAGEGNVECQGEFEILDGIAVEYLTERMTGDF